MGISNCHQCPFLIDIGRFRHDHLVPLAICSRIAEYESLSERLKLQGAVLLEPLTLQQAYAYLNRAGPTLFSIRNILEGEPELQELTQSPLMLNIMVMAYQNATPEELSLTDATQTRRQHVFNTYIRQMFVRHETKPIYLPTQTINWLQWLATRLGEYGQSIFLIEQMQPSWLQINGQKRSFMPFIMLLTMPIYGLIFGLSDGLVVGLIWGPIIAVIATVIFGFAAITSGYQAPKLMLLLLLIDGLQDKPMIYLLICLIISLNFGLMLGLIFGLSDWFSGRFKKIEPVEQSSTLMSRVKSSLYAALFWGLVGGSSRALNIMLVYRQYLKFEEREPLALAYGLIATLAYGLIGSLIGILRPIELIKHLSWSWQRIKNNLYFGLSNMLIFVLISTLLSGPIMVLIASIFMISNIELSGLIIASVLIAPGYVLTATIVSGILGGILSVTMFQPSTGTNILFKGATPNQGIKLSIRFSLITSSIFGLIVWMIFSVIIGVFIAKTYKQNTGFSHEVGIALLGGLPFGLVCAQIGWLLGGGDVIMKHYLLRLILWWKGHIPWSYARFLNYAASLIFLRKVGGGYIFIHRLMMEHFANLDKDVIERITSTSTKQK